MHPVAPTYPTSRSIPAVLLIEFTRPRWRMACLHDYESAPCSSITIATRTHPWRDWKAQRQSRGEFVGRERIGCYFSRLATAKGTLAMRCRWNDRGETGAYPGGGSLCAYRVATNWSDATPVRTSCGTCTHRAGTKRSPRNPPDQCHEYHYRKLEEHRRTG